MNEYLKQVNSLPFYLIVGGVLLFILIMCVWFLVKSYRAGIAIGMDKKVMRRAIMSSATFSILPGVSILLGVIALSGSLGVPLSWLRLSVVGALQYELNVAEIAATSMGLSGLKVSEMSIAAFTTIALVMTAGILSGITCCIFGLKKISDQVSEKREKSRRQPSRFWSLCDYCYVYRPLQRVYRFLCRYMDCVQKSSAPYGGRCFRTDNGSF